ncbi:MAG: hypothetical protein LBD35_06785 [Prevotellaceae bacterium]|nr:hypothetical protein [Prevotellaceae bacterium]
MKNITEIYFLPETSDDDSIRIGERTTNAPSFLEGAGEESFAARESKLYFNFAGFITECIMVDTSADFHFREMFEYGDNNLLQHKTAYLSNEFFYRQTFRYDSRNREKERKFYDGEQHLFEIVSIAYPDRNTVLEKVISDEDNTNSAFEIEISKRDGYPIQSITRTDSVLLERWTCEYDNIGRISLSRLYDGENNLVKHIKYAYDESGNETEYTEYSDSDEPLVERKFLYRYDENGNWTEKAVITDFFPEIIIARKIVYYE